MNRLLNNRSQLRIQVASFSVLLAGTVFISAASALDLDFNVASGNYNVNTNWIDQGDNVAVPPVAPAPPASPPGVLDHAYVRNDGTVTVNSNVQNDEFRIGYVKVINTIPDYNANLIVDPGDYVLWRKGGPLQNDSSPNSVGPNDYTIWRAAYGATGPLNIGRSGTLNWTNGEITGATPDPLTPGDIYSGGPDVRVGRTETINGVITEVPGYVVQNGAQTKLLLPYQQSRLIIGDGSGSVLHSQNSSYTLMAGTIGTAIGNSFFQNNGTNGNNGINVRSGTFTMTGGSIFPAQWDPKLGIHVT